jgi:hypothetical protein
MPFFTFQSLSATMPPNDFLRIQVEADSAESALKRLQDDDPCWRDGAQLVNDKPHAVWRKRNP